MKRIALSVLAFLFGAAAVCGLIWLAGFDFDRRGAAAVHAAMQSLLVGGALAAWAWLNIKEPTK